MSVVAEIGSGSFEFLTELFRNIAAASKLCGFLNQGLYRPECVLKAGAMFRQPEVTLGFGIGFWYQFAFKIIGMVKCKDP